MKILLTSILFAIKSFVFIVPFGTSISHSGSKVLIPIRLFDVSIQTKLFSSIDETFVPESVIALKVPIKLLIDDDMYN